MFFVVVSELYYSTLLGSLHIYANYLLVHLAFLTVSLVTVCCRPVFFSAYNTAFMLKVELY